MVENINLTENERKYIDDFRKQFRTGLLTLLFSDIVESTKLKSELGDVAGNLLIEQHNKLVRNLIQRYPESREISTAGDSFFIIFASPSDAVRFALQFNALLREQNKSSPKALSVRIGIHIGEVQIRTDLIKMDILGFQVDVASRISSLAMANQILMSRAVFDNARQILRGEEIESIGSLSWLNHGLYRVKGLEEAMEICEAGEEGFAPLVSPKDSEKAHRFVSIDYEPVLGWRPAVNTEIPSAPGWILIDKLGEGGFGEVWKAKQKQTKEIRVFKFCFKEDKIRSLKRELSIFRLLKEHCGEHPNIVRLYDVYMEKSPYYLVEEFVEGSNLTKWLDAQGGCSKIPLMVKIEIACQISRALGAAEKAGVIHRDVKPSNIIINSNGLENIKVKLTDFGIGVVTDIKRIQALNLTISSGFTQLITSGSSGSETAGTRLYMAPELIEGKIATPRSDLYSLGIILYQMIVGDMNRALAGDWIGDIKDPIIREDLKLCLAREPEKRLPGAENLEKRLREYNRRRVKYITKRTTMIVASIIILLMISIYGIFIYKENLKSKDMNKKIAQKEEYDKKTQTRLSDLRKEYQSWNIEAVVRCNKMELDRFDKDANPILISDESTSQSTTDENVLGDARKDYRIYDVAFSPDKKLVAFGTKDKSLVLLESKTMQPLKIRGVSGFQTLWIKNGPGKGPAFSPDSKSIVAGSIGNNIYVWFDIATGNVIRSFNYPDYWAFQAAFHPKGKWLALGGWNYKGVYLFDKEAQSKEEEKISPTKILETKINYIYELAFSPDGKWLAASGVPGMHLWNTETWEQVGGLISTGAWYTLGFSQDSKYIIFAGTSVYDLNTNKGGGQEIIVWDLNASKELYPMITDGHKGPGISILILPDNKTFITSAFDKSVIFWDLQTGKQKYKISTIYSVTVLALSPNNPDSILAGNEVGQVEEWNITSTPSPISIVADLALMITQPGRYLQGEESKMVKFKPDPGTSEFRWNKISFNDKNELTLYGDKILHTQKIEESSFGGEFAIIQYNRKLALAFKELSYTQYNKTYYNLNSTVFLTYNPNIQKFELYECPKMKLISAISSDIMTWTAAGLPAAISPDSSLLAQYYNGEVQLYKLPSFEKSKSFKYEKSNVFAMEFSPSGGQLIFHSFDQSIMSVYNTNGELLWEKDKIYSGLGFGLLSQNCLTCFIDGKLNILNCADGKKANLSPEILIDEEKVYEISNYKAFDIDEINGIIAFVSNNPSSIVLFDLVTGEQVQTFIPENIFHTYFKAEPLSVAFSKDGKMLAASFKDGPIRFWKKINK